MTDNGKIIGVDVDLTVVDVLTEWIDWYKNLTGHDISEEIKNVSYNVEDLMKKHFDPLSFWRKPDLYDNLEPIPEAVKYLKLLKQKGFKIVFASSCFPEHETSKKLFLKRNFPVDGFLSTSDKQFVTCNYFIDDYDKYLNKINEFNSNIKCFRIDSLLNKDKPTKWNNGTWEDFYNFVINTSED
jgi:5'(3')-deoxyribonucleotidase